MSRVLLWDGSANSGTILADGGRGIRLEAWGIIYRV